MDSSTTVEKPSDVIEMNNELAAFGANLKSLRASAGISQEHLAELSGLDRTYVSDVERGKRNLGLRNIHTLARALLIEPADLFPKGTSDRKMSEYLIDPEFHIECGFSVTSLSVRNSVERANTVMNALPTSLFRTVDFKAQSGMVGAVFASELASEVGAIPNPIEKGHPDIVPTGAAGATEAELRNYPQGLEVKSTVGSIVKGTKRTPGAARIGVLTNITWQAHHRDVHQLMSIVWDYVGGTPEKSAAPSITGVFFADNLTPDDWGAISGTTGRNTKVTGMTASGRAKMASGAVALISDEHYLMSFRKKVGPLSHHFRK